jgi:hypothetical protein
MPLNPSPTYALSPTTNETALVRATPGKSAMARPLICCDVIFPKIFERLKMRDIDIDPYQLQLHFSAFFLYQPKAFAPPL